LKSTKGSPFLMDMSCSIPLWSPTTTCIMWNKTRNSHKCQKSISSIHVGTFKYI
jgi:hypothetical protein